MRSSLVRSLPFLLIFLILVAVFPFFFRFSSRPCISFLSRLQYWFCSTSAACWHQISPFSSASWSSLSHNACWSIFSHWVSGWTWRISPCRLMGETMLVLKQGGDVCDPRGLSVKRGCCEVFDRCVNAEISTSGTFESVDSSPWSSSDPCSLAFCYE